jgi:hypothetical protein
MCKAFSGTRRVINMDNYYTSPLALIELKKRRILARGTVRCNSKWLPKTVQISKSQSKQYSRGHYRMAVNYANGIAAYGWIDGNPVNIITTADSTKETTVRRQVKNRKMCVRAPEVIKNYNKSMHAVDRNDQLRQLFSLTGRHKFKKYYVRIIMSLLDFALVNAQIHYFMANKTEATGDKKCSA